MSMCTRRSVVNGIASTTRRARTSLAPDAALEAQRVRSRRRPGARASSTQPVSIASSSAAPSALRDQIVAAAHVEALVALAEDPEGLRCRDRSAVRKLSADCSVDLQARTRSCRRRRAACASQPDRAGAVEPLGERLAVERLGRRPARVGDLLVRRVSRSRARSRAASGGKRAAISCSAVRRPGEEPDVAVERGGRSSDEVVESRLELGGERCGCARGRCRSARRRARRPDRRGNGRAG